MSDFAKPHKANVSGWLEGSWGGGLVALTGWSGKAATYELRRAILNYLQF